MKILKDREHSLFIKSFGIRDTLYLAVTIFIYFDLNSPDDPLKEQEMWKTLPEELGQDFILDQGMAKPHGEFLVTGSCFAPRGKTRPASRVSVRVGDQTKILNVFGHRFWKRAGKTAQVITRPRPFSEMPLSWENAFGGEGFEKNPSGKGIHPVTGPKGRSRIPLPNIEYPEHLVGAPGDRPDPAGFAPLGMMWRPRSDKTGTYDDAWLRQRWPHFPDDMNYEFFNAAPEDQYIPDFFTGGEIVEILNMHPDLPMIQSHLPRLRIRCFATKQKDLHSSAENNMLFQEVTTRMDTVWLFPSILRGVVMYRGTTEILDEEYYDVRRIFLATEKADEAPKTIQHYQEEQFQRLDKKVPIDPAPIQAAKKKAAKAMRHARNVPKMVAEVKKKVLGKSPIMPRTPTEMAARSQGTIAGGMAVLDKMEALARSMHAKHGHLVKIDLDHFAKTREKLKQTSKKVDQAAQKAEQAKTKAAGIKADLKKKASDLQKQAAEKLKENAPPDHQEKMILDVDALFPSKTVNPWHDHGFPFVVQCRRNLETDPDTQKILQDLGLERRTVKRAWLGLNPELREEDAAAWGLKPKEETTGDVPPLEIPPGLVMPRFDGAVLNRILVRTAALQGSAAALRDVLVDGSDETPLVLPAAIEDAPFVRVATELEALLVEEEVGDACAVVALWDPSEEPDKDTKEAIDAYDVFLVVMPDDPSFESEWEGWKKTYPNAQKLLLPHGWSVFDSRRKGTDIRKWILDALPPHFADHHRLELEDAEGKTSLAAMSFPALNIKGLSKQLREEAAAKFQPKKDAAKALKKEMETKAREGYSKAGYDFDAVKASVKKRPAGSFGKMGDEMAKQLDSQSQRLQAQGLLTPEIEKDLREGAAKARSMGQKAESQYKTGIKRLESAKKEIAAKTKMARSGELPGGMKKSFKDAGIDPDNVKKLTREEVIERHAQGKSLAGAILSGVDLSGLDLQGIDLRKAQCGKTNFSGSNLDGAVFTQSLASEADFSDASLQKAILEKGIFNKAKFKKAVVREADFSQAMLGETDFGEADCEGANFHMVILTKANLNQARMKNIRAELSIMSGVNLTDAVLHGASFQRCVLKDAVLDRADFSGAALNSTLLNGAKGEDVSFVGADMNKARMGGNTELRGADFRNIVMKQGCLRDSDLSGANFKGSVIEESIIENCDLREANMQRISAKKTRFTRSNLEKAKMRGINLLFGSLRKARLVNTDLRDANLVGIDVYKAVVGDTNFDGANLKKTQLYKRTDLLT